MRVLKCLGMFLIAAAYFGGGSAFGELITNSNFSGGTAGFRSDYSVVTWNGGGFDDQEEQEIGVVSSPQMWNPDFAEFGDHTTGSGLMLIANGAGDEYQRVWWQTIPIELGTTYNVSFWAANASDTTPANLAFDISYDLYNTANLVSLDLTGAGVGSWVQGTGQFTATLTGNVKLWIRDTVQASAGNDFALDDISVTTAHLPEPSSFMLLGIGSIIGLGIYTRRRPKV